MMDADPLFADIDHLDLHIFHHSPCRNAGDDNAPGLPAEDFEGDPRIAHGAVDLGADEFATHLYYTGDATPGGSVKIKLAGLPGAAPVGLCIGTGILDPPLPSPWGPWHLAFPISGPLDLGTIPSPEGMLVYSGSLPTTPPGPYTLPMQAIVGDALTNCCVLEVE
jgi:hypothetical protein